MDTETFKSVYYPQAKGLRAVAVRMNFAANRYDGEEQITKALTEAKKFRPKVDEEFDALRSRIEMDLFSSKKLPWSDVKRAAAMQQGFVMLPPKGLEHIRDQCVDVRKLWREHPGDYVEKPPFAPDKTGILPPKTLLRDDVTGRTCLEIKAVHGDRVHWGRSAAVSTSSPIVEGEVLETNDVALWFLCLDTRHLAGSEGYHETGDPFAWTGKVEVKIDPQSGATTRTMALTSVPPGAAIRYTTNDSEPASSGIAYAGQITIPEEGCAVAAVAEKDGVRSEKVTYRFLSRLGGSGGGEAPKVDPHAPARWRSHLRFVTTEDAYKAMKAAKDAMATVSGVEIDVISADDSAAFLSLVLGESVGLPAAELERVLVDLQARLPGGEVSLKAPIVSFETGADLDRFSDAIGHSYELKDVVQ